MTDVQKKVEDIFDALQGLQDLFLEFSLLVQEAKLVEPKE